MNHIYDPETFFSFEYLHTKKPIIRKTQFWIKTKIILVGAERHRFFQQEFVILVFVIPPNSERVGHSDFGLCEHKAKAIALILHPVALGLIFQQRSLHSRYFRGTVLEAEEHFVIFAVSAELTPSVKYANLFF